MPPNQPTHKKENIHEFDSDGEVLTQAFRLDGLTCDEEGNTKRNRHDGQIRNTDEIEQNAPSKLVH
jgi:hypothetical protein